MMVAARSYAAARQTDKSEKALRTVVEADPNNLKAYIMLGRIYGEQHRLDEALVEFDAAAARRPSQVAAATMAAVILEMQNKIRETQKRYEAIVAGNQQAPIAANNLAWVYVERGGNLDVALQLTQAATAQVPHLPEVTDTLG